jgi:hypothetical protein
VLDGVYQCVADGAVEFVEVGAPTAEELHALLHTVITRLMTMLTRRGSADRVFAAPVRTMTQ